VLFRGWFRIALGHETVELILVLGAPQLGKIFAEGLLLFFERFYVLRVYLNRFLEWLGLEPAF